MSNETYLKKYIGKEVTSEDQLINGKTYILRYYLPTIYGRVILRTIQFVKIKYWYDPSKHWEYPIYFEDIATYTKTGFSYDPQSLLQYCKKLGVQIFEYQDKNQ